jgi:hypothetical protein
VQIGQFDKLARTAGNRYLECIMEALFRDRVKAFGASAVIPKPNVMTGRERC